MNARRKTTTAAAVAVLAMAGLGLAGCSSVPDGAQEAYEADIAKNGIGANYEQPGTVEKFEATHDGGEGDYYTYTATVKHEAYTMTDSGTLVYDSETGEWDVDSADRTCTVTAPLELADGEKIDCKSREVGAKSDYTCETRGVEKTEAEEWAPEETYKTTWTVKDCRWTAGERETVSVKPNYSPAAFEGAWEEESYGWEDDVCRFEVKNLDPDSGEFDLDFTVEPEESAWGDTPPGPFTASFHGKLTDKTANAHGIHGFTASGKDMAGKSHDLTGTFDLYSPINRMSVELPDMVYEWDGHSKDMTYKCESLFISAATTKK